MPFARLVDPYYLVVVALVELSSWASWSRTVIARTLGGLAYRCSRRKRAAMSASLACAFDGDPRSAAGARILRGAFVEFWAEILTARPTRAQLDAARRAEIRGLDHLERAAAAGKGVILWESNGLGRRYLLQQILAARGHRVHQVHGPDHLGGLSAPEGSDSWIGTHWVRRFFDSCEKRFAASVLYLPRSGDLVFTRVLLGLLRRGGVLCVAGDGRQGQRLFSLPFLGQEALFSPGMVSLAKLAGAPLLPVSCVWDAGQPPVLEIHEPIRITASADREDGLRQSVQEYVTLLEVAIRRDPARYRNWHLVGADVAVR